MELRTVPFCFPGKGSMSPENNYQENTYLFSFHWLFCLKGERGLILEPVSKISDKVIINDKSINR